MFASGWVLPIALGVFAGNLSTLLLLAGARALRNWFIEAFS